MPNPEPTSPRLERSLLLAILLATILAYARVGGNGFINWDDPGWVTENPLWQAPNPLYSIWFTLEAHQYYPLSFTLLWIEHHLFGDAPAGYHWVSLGFHLLATWGFYALLRRLRFDLIASIIAAAVVAIHPLQVAAVAWAVEQKTMFAAAAIWWSFERYIAAEESGSRRSYVLSLVLFICAMLAKTQPLLLAVLFPLARPLLGRVRPAAGRGAGLSSLLRLYRIAWPHLVIAVVLAIPTIIRERSPLDEGNLTIPERAVAMGRGLWFYLGKFAWPRELSGLYPLWKIDLRDGTAFLWPLAAAILAGILIWRARRQPTLAFASLLCVLTWLPASCIVPFGHMEKSYVADHLVYFSLGGLGLLFGLLVRWALRQGDRTRRVPIIGLTVLSLIAFGVTTFLRIGTYRNSITFWQQVLSIDPRSLSGNNNLGTALAEAGRITEAIPLYRTGIEVRPGYYELRINYADALYRTGDRDGAIEQLKFALRAKPGDDLATRRLAALGAGTIDAAQEEGLRARASAEPPNEATEQLALARFLIDSGRGEEAVTLLKSTLERPLPAPTRGPVLGELGYVLVSLRRYEAALAAYQEQLSHDPGSPTVRMNVGVMLRRLGRFKEAIAELERAQRQAPANEQIRYNLEKAHRAER
ncbi:MAG: tetratricopeptide repeat protein [Candidatus Eisenbacteria bacterium]|nr:tetratricopeptide repeat protein [Candidatus Eisenbacteria bacterium]